MDSRKIAFEPIDGLDKAARIPLGNVRDAQFILEVLQDTFDACFEKGICKFIVDLENIEYPSSSLVALLVESTSRARRNKGDVKIVNLPKQTLRKIESFSTTYYLSITEEEAVALKEFGWVEKEATKGKIVPQDEVVPTEDIADDPIINEIETKFSRETTVGQHQKDVPTKAMEEGSVQQVQGERNHLRVKSDPQNLYNICDFVTKYAERAGCDPKEIGKMKIAVYEASLNVIEHAYRSNPDNWMDVWIEYNSEMFKVIIQDYGSGFEGFSNKKYDVVSAMDDRQTGGFGLYIIRRAMDQIDYRPDPKRGNRLTMIKFLSNHEPNNPQES